MENNNKKRFLTYKQQIDLLKSKNLEIEDEEFAIDKLKQNSYYSLISGYKDIFKIKKNGDYKEDASFHKLYRLSVFDESLRYMFLQEFIRIEKHIKSLYSYSFCELYGDKQVDYLNATNYHYAKYQNDINKFTSSISNLINQPGHYHYVKYNVDKYETVPLWVIIQTLTFGNLSKMYMFSKDELKSRIAKNFDKVYSKELTSMLNVLSKFRNVCAHGERLFTYKTKNSISDLPVHKEITNYNFTSKNNLFNVVICLKYLSQKDDFSNFFEALEELINTMPSLLGDNYAQTVLQKMGFPENWKEIKNN